MEFAKNLLDQYFSTKKTKSATAHSNVHGITVTVRFSHEDLIKYGDGSVAASESDTQESQSFKRISQKQFKRNKQRYGNFKNKQDLENKPPKVIQTRSKSRSDQIEDTRACDNSLDNSVPFISPEPVKHTVSEADSDGASATQCCSAESPHSPDNTASDFDIYTSPSVIQLEESASNIVMPSVQADEDGLCLANDNSSAYTASNDIPKSDSTPSRKAPKTRDEIEEESLRRVLRQCFDQTFRSLPKSRYETSLARPGDDT